MAGQITHSFFLPLCFTIFCFSAFAQETTPEWKLKAEKLKSEGLNLSGRQEFDSAVTLTNEALSLAIENDDPLFQARCLNNLGMIYSRFGKHPMSFYYYSQSLSMLRRMEKDSLICRSLVNLGIAYKEQGIHDLALEQLFEGAEMAQRLNLRKELASSYNAIANIFTDDSNYSQALIYHSKVLALGELKPEVSLNNIGKVYKKMHLLDSALFYLDSSLVLKEKRGDSSLLPSTLSNIADIYSLQGKLSLALGTYNRALAIAESLNNPQLLSLLHLDLGTVYSKTGLYKEALKHLLEAENYGGKANARDILLSVYQAAQHTYRKLGNLEASLTYYDLYSMLFRELTNRERKETFARMQVKYETIEKQKEIDHLNTVSEKQVIELKARKRNIIALILIITLACIVLVTLFILFKLKARSAKRIDMLMRELHHRVKNNLQSLSALISLQKGQIRNPDAKGALVSLENRVRSMVLIHNKLYFRADVTMIRAKSYIQELSSGLMSGFGFSPGDILVTVDVNDDLQLQSDKALPLGLICNEILSNAFKYAFVPGKQGQKLEIELREHEHAYRLYTKDNGPGFEEGQPGAPGFGKKLIHNLVKQLQGTIKESSGNGVEYTITFPFRV